MHLAKDEEDLIFWHLTPAINRVYYSIHSNKENMRLIQTPDMTVQKLMDFLKNLDPNLPVQIAMNGEYQWMAERVTVETIDGEPYVRISDEF